MNPGVEVKVNGTAIHVDEPELIYEVRVDDNQWLPDTFFVNLSPDWDVLADAQSLLGAEVEILFAGPGGNSMVSLLEGQILSVEPSFGEAVSTNVGSGQQRRVRGIPTGAKLAFRGYDHSHKLHRTKRQETFVNSTVADIARKVARTAGMQCDKVDNAGGARPFTQQNNETDWEFLWRLAKEIDFIVFVSKKKLNFVKAGPTRDPIELGFGDNLLKFTPRVSGAQQFEEFVVRGWDESSKQPIEKRARASGVDASIGISRDAALKAGGGGTMVVADRPLPSAEAEALAKSLAAQNANSYLTGEGSATGNPDLRAGSKVKIKDLSRSFDGIYPVSATTHRFRGNFGYETGFTIAGRSGRSFIELMSPPAKRGFGNSVVIGKVTQNDDGRHPAQVKVNFPALGTKLESAWARVSTPSAGKDRGLLMLPVPDEEVLVAFEHDDVTRPYVIGSVWNGKDTPGDLHQKDGSFVLKSDKFMNLTSKDTITIKADKDFVLETKGKLNQKTTGDMTIEGSAKLTQKLGSSMNVKSGSDVVVEAGTSMTLKGATTVTIKGGGGTIELGPAGVTIKGGMVKIN